MGYYAIMFAVFFAVGLAFQFAGDCEASPEQYEEAKAMAARSKAAMSILTAIMAKGKLTKSRFHDMKQAIAREDTLRFLEQASKAA